MRPNGRVHAAAAPAVSLCCGGSLPLPPPATQPAAGGPPAQSPAAAGVGNRQRRAVDLLLVSLPAARRTVSR